MSTGRGPNVDDARQIVKSALRRAAKLGGGAVGLSIDLGLSEAHLSNCQNPHRREMIGAHHALVIDGLIGSPVLLNAMARELDYMLVRLDRDNSGRPCLQDLLRLVGDSSGLSQTLGEALADDIIDANEAVQLDTQIEAFIRSLRTLQDKVKAGGR